MYSGIGIGRIDPVETALQAFGHASALTSTTDVVNVYDNWSTYDEACAVRNYKGAKVAADAVVKYLSDNTDVSVLDVAAGTGLVGEELKAHGFNNIDALDASEGMLNMARQKKVYKNYIQEFFPCEKPSIKTSSYDVLLISAGIGASHVNYDCLPEMVRCVKTGGLVVIANRRDALRYEENHVQNLADYIDQLEALIKQLETEGEWQILERTVIPNFFPNANGVLFVLKVTKGDN